MGVFKALNQSISSITKDLWKDYFYCDSLSNNVLMSRGVRKNDTGNNRGSENVISHGSIVIVNEGQTILMVRNGEVVDVCSRPGAYIYEYVERADIPAQRLKEGFRGFISDVATRLAYAGEVTEDHRVYYVNTKDILGNIFGTANPIPFRVIDNNIGFDSDISIRCNGEFVFRITNPALFYKTLCGNVQSEFRREDIESNLKTDVISSLYGAFGAISEMGIRYNQIASHSTTLSEILDKALDDKWGMLYGINLTSISFGTIKANEEDEAMLKDLQRTSVFRNPNMAMANFVTAQADAMKLAAANTSVGPIMAFAGMNSMMNAQSPSMSLLYNMQQSVAPAQQMQPMSRQADTWRCNCGNMASGNFCSNCGSQKNVNITCPTCGSIYSPNTPVKFCSNCGTALK